MLTMLDLKILALEAALETDFHEHTEWLLEAAQEIYQWLLDEDC